MYGEKQEETEELKLDLQDIKTMYKAQVDVCDVKIYLSVTTKMLTTPAFLHFVDPRTTDSKIISHIY